MNATAKAPKIKKLTKKEVFLINLENMFERVNTDNIRAAQRADKLEAVNNAEAFFYDMQRAKSNAFIAAKGDMTNETYLSAEAATKAANEVYNLLMQELHAFEEANPDTIN